MLSIVKRIEELRSLCRDKVEYAAQLKLLETHISALRESAEKDAAIPSFDEQVGAAANKIAEQTQCVKMSDVELNYSPALSNLSSSEESLFITSEDASEASGEPSSTTSEIAPDPTINKPTGATRNTAKKETSSTTKHAPQTAINNLRSANLRERKPSSTTKNAPQTAINKLTGANQRKRKPLSTTKNALETAINEPTNAHRTVEASHGESDDLFIVEENR